MEPYEEKLINTKPVKKFSKLILYSMIMIWMSGCDEAKTIVEMYGKDSSESYVFPIDSPQYAFKQYTEMLGIAGDEAHTLNDITLYFTYMGNDVRPEIRSIYLPAGKWWENRIQRIGTIQRFKEELYAEVGQWHAIKNHQRTYLFQSMAYQLALLSSNRSADLVQGIFYTDTFQDDGEIVFADYIDNIEAFIKEKPSISKKLNSRYPMPDLTGITITIINKPARFELIPLTEASLDFWKTELESHGAKVVIRSNILETLQITEL